MNVNSRSTQKLPHAKKDRQGYGLHGGGVPRGAGSDPERQRAGAVQDALRLRGRG